MSYKIFKELNDIRDWATLDTETTGLSKKDEVIEVSIVRHDGVVLFNSLVRPTCQVNFAARKIHKISDSELYSSDYWKDIEVDFINAINSVDRILIFNDSFDIRLLSQTYESANLNMPSINTVCVSKAFNNYCSEYGRLVGKKKNLDSACLEMGVSFEGIDRHRSLGDCFLTRNLVLSVVNSSIDKSINDTAIDDLDCLKDVGLIINEAVSASRNMPEYITELKKHDIYMIPANINSTTK